jgi:DNA mismatch endonuclease (patch repair protein)
MADVVTPEKRSRMMSGIRGKNTKPEILVRSILHRKGYRFRIHVPNLPGKPDVVLPKYTAVILINGCFWHGHDCHLFKWPSTRQEFWHNKITGNRTTDLRNRQLLKEEGWRILIIWECSLKGKNRLKFDDIVDKIVNWLEADTSDCEIKGKS